MSFGSVLFTNQGKTLQAKAQAGAQLSFTHISVGDGELSGQAIADLTNLVHEVKSLTINKFKALTDGQAVVGGVLSNQEITTGFYWRELGLFATDPDVGEILYCYGNAGALAEYIPTPGGSEIIEKQVDINAIIGNASSVSAVINESLVYETPLGAQEKANAAEQNAKDYANENKIDKTSISDSVESDDSETVASSKAVKTAYDKATNANELLVLIKTVDGTGSGLDADLVDGKEASGTLETTEKVNLVIAINEIVTAVSDIKNNLRKHRIGGI